MSKKVTGVVIAGRQPTLEDVKGVVSMFFGDTSRSRSETREGLGELVDDIRTMLDAMDEDGSEE